MEIIQHRITSTPDNPAIVATQAWTDLLAIVTNSWRSGSRTVSLESLGNADGTMHAVVTMAQLVEPVDETTPMPVLLLGGYVHDVPNTLINMVSGSAVSPATITNLYDVHTCKFTSLSGDVRLVYLCEIILADTP